MLTNVLIGVSLLIFSASLRIGRKAHPVTLFLLIASAGYALMIQVFDPERHPQFEYALFAAISVSIVVLLVDLYRPRLNREA